MKKSRLFFGGVVALYFIIGLEIIIMISPFAAFFYAAFNPLLLFLVQYPATRWLTAFFLPHMISPPNLLLKSIRISGSILFIAGSAIFLVCAGQVYFNKFFKKGIALRGLYSFIRHPQYLGLGLTGLGLAILWPRFLVIALWNVMMILYYLLALDEEKRMLGQFNTEYRQYMNRTGMFLPKGLEYMLPRLSFPHGTFFKAIIVLALMVSITLGSAFLLRSYTINNLPLWHDESVTAVAILPDDLSILKHRMASVLELPEIASRLKTKPGPFLVYFMPKNYIMQGMIADTGGEWQLYKRHHTIEMIGDWIFHPFHHLEGGHVMMHHEMLDKKTGHPVEGGIVRRMIFLQVEIPNNLSTPSNLFGINTQRLPLFVADVEIHNLVLKDVRDLAPVTSWGKVPTPIF
jgi:protein-S-isoprenylcysteine O-methyltransferase Ste14